MALTVVIAPTWEKYEAYCESKGWEHSDRKVVVPLVTYTDKYRLWGRNLRGARVVRIGECPDSLMSIFRHELKKSGWTKE